MKLTRDNSFEYFHQHFCEFAETYWDLIKELSPEDPLISGFPGWSRWAEILVNQDTDGYISFIIHCKRDGYIGYRRPFKEMWEQWWGTYHHHENWLAAIKPYLPKKKKIPE